MLFIDRHGEAAFALSEALSGENMVARLEGELASALGKEAVAVCSTDAALHTALHLCGVSDGDYVFVPTFTFYSYIATVTHSGGVPVFLDCDPNTRCVSAAALETALLWSELQRKPPKAVVVDNAFGSIADYDVLVPLCKAHGVPLIELCCDAQGGRYKGKPCGANGDYGVIGFDKRLMGGGGALVCGDEKGAAQKFTRFVYSDGENHDYRINNCVAALDLAQRDASEKITARARKNLAALCSSTDCVAQPTDGDAGIYALVKAARLTATLIANGYDVKTPPPVHSLPQYRDCFYFEHEQGYSVCRTFDDYCLIGMDISIFARSRLIRFLNSGA
ncbi:MAG: DegT/DnrJ/EryC1/StrS aminotransferase family protein [Clostridiales bacterium]|nr:DegT/DnrJ/EryC1/StrS aminotransferase family protein [Clostridiales bacterium]